MLPALGRTMPMSFHQGRLAVAVGAEQHDGLAATDLERHVVNHAYRAIGGMDA